MLEAGMICHLRLTNGDEVFGKFVSFTGESYILDSPMVVESYENSITLSKYILFSDAKEIVFSMMHVVTVTQVYPQFERYYYASLEYSKRYIEEKVLDGISMTSRALENHLSNDISEIKTKDDKVKTVSKDRLYIPNPMSIH